MNKLFKVAHIFKKKLAQNEEDLFKKDDPSLTSDDLATLKYVLRYVNEISRDLESGIPVEQIVQDLASWVDANRDTFNNSFAKINYMSQNINADVNSKSQISESPSSVDYTWSEDSHGGASENTYSGSAEGVYIDRKRAERELAQHGLDPDEEFEKFWKVNVDKNGEIDAGALMWFLNY